MLGAAAIAHLSEAVIPCPRGIVNRGVSVAV